MAIDAATDGRREMDEVQKADPRTRRRALAMLLIVGGLGAAVIFVVDDWLASQRVADPEAARRALLRFVRWAAVGNAVVMAGFAAYAWRMGCRIRRDGRYPPLGQMVVRDTAILTGTPARRRGAAAQAAALVLVVLALVSLVGGVVLAARLA
jgi:hypothetical protein